MPCGSAAAGGELIGDPIAPAIPMHVVPRPADDPKRRLTLRQADRARNDFAEILYARPKG
jgi:hypothetical protein